MMELMRRTVCHKKPFEADLRLLFTRKYTGPGDTPRIEHRCPRCETRNIFTHAPAAYVAE